MALAQLDLKAVQSEEMFSEVMYTSAQDAIQQFQFLPKSLYVRQELNTSDDNISEYISHLTFPLTGNKVSIRIVDPIVVFTLTEAQIVAWGLDDDVKPGVTYILNGNNRINALHSILSKEQRGAEFAPVPYTVLNNGVISVDLIFRLQSTYNDTTQKHSAIEKMFSIARMLERFNAAGVAPAEARKRIITLFPSKISDVLISQAKKFSDIGLSSEEIQGRKFLFEMLDAGAFSVDSALTIIQIAEQNDSSIPYVVESLIKAVGVMQEDGRIKPIGKTQITKWRPSFEQKLREGKTAEGDDESPETNEPKGKKEPKVFTPEAIEEAKTHIRSAAQTTLAIAQRDEEESPDMGTHYLRAGKQLVTILSEIAPNVDIEKAQKLFQTLSEVTLGLLADDALMARIDPEIKVRVAVTSAKLEKELYKIIDKDSKPDEEGEEDEEGEDEETEFLDEVDQTVASDEEDEEEYEDDEEEEDIEA